MSRALSVLGVVGLLAAATTVPPAETAQTAVVALREGQSATVAGTDLTVTALKVTDLFAAGCRGGALGCPNTAELRVTHGQAVREVTLSLRQAFREPRTIPRRLEENLEPNQVVVFGYRVILASLKGHDIVLRVEKTAE